MHRLSFSSIIFLHHFPPSHFPPFRTTKTRNYRKAIARIFANIREYSRIFVNIFAKMCEYSRIFANIFANISPILANHERIWFANIREYFLFVETLLGSEFLPFLLSVLQDGEQYHDKHHSEHYNKHNVHHHRCVILHPQWNLHQKMVVINAKYKFLHDYN